MAKAQKEAVFFVASSGSGFFYTKRRNKKKGKGEKKLSFKKYDPIARKHVLFEEKKLSRLKKKFNPEAAESKEAKKDSKKSAASEAA